MTTPTPRQTVGALIDEFGFDAVDVGPLAEGWRYQPDTPAYNVRQDADELRAALAAGDAPHRGGLTPPRSPRASPAVR